MAYAVTLPLDDVAASRVRGIWHALAEHADAGDAIRLDYAPHITLIILADAAPIAEVEEAAFRTVSRWPTLSLILAGLGLFPGKPPVIWAAPVVTAELLAKHAELHAALSAFNVHPHYLPGSWIPHVTLSKDGSASAAHLVEAATSAWHGPITTCLERVELVHFRPVKVLRSQTLASER